jgi:hypothetical protein
MGGLTPTAKGAIAELAIASAATQQGIVVSRPMTEGVRYDLIFDIRGDLLRVQCKWANFRNGVVVVVPRTNRTTPSGYVRGTYSAVEIDVIAAYCHALGEVYLIPIAELDGRTYLHLRITPTRNNQVLGVKWAETYRLGAVAQLGERVAGSHEVRGSSPLSSTAEEAVHPGGLFA